MRSWVSGTMAARAKKMKSTNIITIKILDKMSPKNVFKNTLLVDVGKVKSIGDKEFHKHGNKNDKTG